MPSQFRAEVRVSRFPTRNKDIFARESRTTFRLSSTKNPNFPFILERTKETIITFRSSPWNESTVPRCIPER